MNHRYEFIEFKNEIPIKSFIVGIKEYAPHLHDEVEIVFVISGSVSITVSNENFKLNTNDFIIINSKEIHCFHKAYNNNIVLIIQNDSNIPVMSHTNIGKVRFQCNSVNFKKEDELKAIDEIRNNLASIIFEICTKKKHYELSLFSMLLRIFTIIFRKFPYHVIDDKALKFGNENLNRISTVFQYIDKNYMYDISYRDAASLLHINEYYFSHLFKKYVGMSFGKYLTKIRVEKAKNLLMSSEKPITEIASECGFANVKMLSRAFRSIEGCSPSQYRYSNIREQHSNFGNDKLSMESYNINIDKDLEDQPYTQVYTGSILNKLSYHPQAEYATESCEIGEKAMSISFNINQHGESYKPYWKKLKCAGRAAEGLRDEWRDQIREVQRELGFEYIRFHGIFHDDMMIYREQDGIETYNWQYFDSLFDFMQEVNLRPVLELSFMPYSLKSGDKTVFWWKGNITPPIDFAKWSNLVKELILHCINKYGKKEVLKWYFEVWNEPNHEVFWNGSQEEYFMLYQHSVNAIKSVDAGLKVGGPAITLDYAREAQWLKDFLAFCEENRLPVDFVSCHPYPTDFVADKNNNTYLIYRDENRTFKDLCLIRDVIEKTRYQNAEIIITEWNSSFIARDIAHDTVYKAPFVIQNNLMCLGLVDGLGYWTFTDIFEELPIDNKAFHGGFGLINIQGLKKPAYYGYWFLSKLGTEKIISGDCYFVARKDDSIQVLIWNYCHYNEAFAKVDPAKFDQFSQYDMFNEKMLYIDLEVTGLNGKYRVIEYVLDRDNGSVYDAWVSMGAPNTLSNEEISILKRKMGPVGSFYTVENTEIYKKSLAIKPHGVYLIEFHRIYE